MTEATPLVSQLLDHASGRASASHSPTQRTYLVLSSVVTSLAAAALWGAAVGCTDGSLALVNAYKVPMVVLLSLLFAAPPALLWLRLSGAGLDGFALVGSAVHGMFAGTVWLGALSPLIGLYFYTSSWAGPTLAMGSVFAALASAWWVFAKRLVQAGGASERQAAVVSGLILCVLQVLVMWQLASLVAPILPDGTMFSAGVDGVWGQ